MTTRNDILDFYAQPASLTSAGRHARLLAPLPTEPRDLLPIVQGLVVYDVVASDFYGVTVPKAREAEIHLRSAEEMLRRLVALDDRPLAEVRTADKRLAGRCHHFVRLLLAMLRAKGMPARARCGFGSYFNPPCFEDHWVVEYWNAREARWALADPQFDDVWREKLKIGHDVLDVPRDRFLVAAEAWTQCRTGRADAARFGIEFEKLRGLWFIAGSLVRDVAALNAMEMLPWDVWGAQPRPDEHLGPQRLAYFDRLAALTLDPDASFAELRALFTDDEGVAVPEAVFNALRRRPESVPIATASEHQLGRDLHLS